MIDNRLDLFGCYQYSLDTIGIKDTNRRIKHITSP
jgi:hypothetical protein